MKKISFFLLALFLFVPFSTFALTNYDTYFGGSYNTVDLSTLTVNNQSFTDFQDLLDDINSTNYSNFKLSYILFPASSYTWLYVYLFPTNISSVNIAYYGLGNPTNYMGLYFDTSNVSYFFQFRSGSWSNNSTNYTNLLSCLNGNSCTSSGNNKNSFDDNSHLVSNSQLNNGNSYDNLIFYTYVLKSDINCVLVSGDDLSLNSNYIFKNFKLNDVLYEVGDNVPPYIYIPPVDPEPEPEPEPEPSDKTFSDYVYWFVTRDGSVENILENIYILLFIYCNFVIIMRLVTVIKNSRF